LSTKFLLFQTTLLHFRGKQRKEILPFQILILFISIQHIPPTGDIFTLAVQITRYQDKYAEKKNVSICETVKRIKSCFLYVSFSICNIMLMSRFTKKKSIHSIQINSLAVVVEVSMMRVRRC